jgi:hypothetical protein
MSDASDLDLQREPVPFAPPPPPRSSIPWIVILIAIAAALLLGWYFLGRAAEETSESTEFTEAPVAADANRPLGGTGPAIDLPPLDQTDSLVRQLLRELTTHPRAAAWLATNGLIRSFTVAVQNIAQGQVPTQALRPLRPTGRFTVIETDTDIRIDPRSYARYDGLADAVSSVDANGAAMLYASLKPRIEEAYAELGESATFDQTLERAIVSLLRAPVPGSDVRLDPKGGVFSYEDAGVERLTAAQKQLVRMGPRNARIIQDKLRAIAVALGIPQERL